MRETTIITQDGTSIACIHSGEVLLKDAPSALELLISAVYEHGCTRVALNKEAVSERFFSLGTGLAGELLQKFVTYRVKLAIYGDFSGYASKPLRDFIYESNRGNEIFFVSTEEEAIERLLRAK